MNTQGINIFKGTEWILTTSVWEENVPKVLQEDTNKESNPKLERVVFLIFN